MWEFVLLFDVQLAEVRCHGISEPAGSLGVIEGAWICCTQSGSHLALAAHLCSWDSETSVSLRMLCQAPHRALASRRCEGLHPLDPTRPGCSWVDQVTLCYDWGGTSTGALRISPSAGTLPGFPTTRVTPLGSSSGSSPFFPLSTKNPFQHQSTL